MRDLEANGLSTSAIRNRKRRRKAVNRPYRTKVAASDDAPSIFSCCAIALAFGDTTEDDEDAYRKLQKQRYEEMQKEQASYEAMLRKRYLKDNGYVGNVMETIEVVE